MKKGLITFIILSTILILATIQGKQSNAQKQVSTSTMNFSIDGKPVYVYGRKSTLQGKKKVPLVLFMNGTGYDPQKQAQSSG